MLATTRCAPGGIRPVCLLLLVGRTRLRIPLSAIGPAQSGYDCDRHDDGLIAMEATYVGYNL